MIFIYKTDTQIKKSVKHVRFLSVNTRTTEYIRYVFRELCKGFLYNI